MYFKKIHPLPGPMCSIQQSRGRERMMKKPDVSLHKMFTLNFTWADFILGLIDGSIMAPIQLLALGLIARQHNISTVLKSHMRGILWKN